MSFFIMPLSIFWLILLAGIAMYLLKRKRTGLVIGIFSIVWLAMISLPFLPTLLVKSLENRFPPLLEISQFHPDDTVNILVLGAGYKINIDLPPNDQLSLNALGRLSEGIRLHRLLHASRFILSGTKRDEKVSGAKLLMKTALALGVEENEISLLSTPETTRMESLEYTNKFGCGKTLVLVTDAIHMPRAMLLFHKAGQSPIPSPTNHMVKSDRKIGIRDWVPASSNIAMMEYAIHEIGGLVYASLFYREIADVKGEVRSEVKR
jgi:uncharacterized SAM-binding protein YcdF (DUF218 family)